MQKKKKEKKAKSFLDQCRLCKNTLHQKKKKKEEEEVEGWVIFGGRWRSFSLLWRDYPEAETTLTSELMNMLFQLFPMYIYHALISALSAHMIHINLNTIFYAHVEHSPTKTVYLR